MRPVLTPGLLSFFVPQASGLRSQAYSRLQPGPNVAQCGVAGRPKTVARLATLDSPSRARHETRSLNPMARPITLFTGQWADLTLSDLARKASDFGYQGLELACWGD